MQKPSFKQSPEAIVLGLVSGLVAIHLLIQWRYDKTVYELIYTAAAIGLLAVLSQKIAFWVATAWMWLGQLLGKVVGTVLLSVVFLLFLTPLAKLQALFLKSDKFKSAGDRDTAWIDRSHAFLQNDLDELW